MKIVYIAGPFRAVTAWGIENNVRRAEEQAVLLVNMFGIMPLIPHANTRFFHGLGSDELWLEGTMELMRRCDAIYMCPGWEQSEGSKAELAEAKSLGIPAFYHDKYEEIGTWLTANPLSIEFHDGRPAEGAVQVVVDMRSACPGCGSTGWTSATGDALTDGNMQLRSCSDCPQ